MRDSRIGMGLAGAAASVAVAAGLGLGAVAATPAMAADWGGTQPMHRLYNPNSGEHFYTASDHERDHLVSVGWRSEGEGWVAPAKSSTPVYRLYNPNAGDHHYTMSRGERDWLVGKGWRYEGIGWYSSDAKAVPLYRQYNPNARTGSHNFTTSRGEQAALVSKGWRAEGTAWYGTSAKAAQGPLSDAYDPRAASPTVAVGSSVDPRSAIADAASLPDGTAFTWAEAPDTSREGTAEGTVTVTYPDGTADSVAVTVTVRAKLMADEYQPAGRRLVVKQGNKPNPYCALTNEGDLPEGTRLSWRATPSTKATGISKATLVATYPDGSSNAVTVTVEVQDEDTFANSWATMKFDGITRVYLIKVPAGSSAANIWGYLSNVDFPSARDAQDYITLCKKTGWYGDVTGYTVVGPFVCAPDYSGWVAVDE